MPMTYWANKTCGHCGFTSPDDLEKRHCDVCDTDKCPVCFKGNPQSPMCQDCAWEKLEKVRRPQ